MLNLNRIVAFVATKDPAKARTFYEKTIGLCFKADDGFALVFDIHGTMLRVAKVKDFTPAPFTILGWEVKDIGNDATELKERGVEFLRFDGFGQDSLGIWTAPSGDKVAWFKDPDGNILSLSQHVS